MIMFVQWAKNIWSHCPPLRPTGAGEVAAAKFILWLTEGASAISENSEKSLIPKHVFPNIPIFRQDYYKYQNFVFLLFQSLWL